MRLCRSHDGERDRGAVLPIVALSLVFLMTMTAFTIDLGRLMLTNRDLQKVSDLVSLDLARRLDGRTVTAIDADPTFRLQMLTSGARNGFDITGDRSLQYQLGAVDTDRNFHQLHGSSVPNAVHVIAGDIVGFFFTPGNRSVSRAATSLGTNNPTCIAPDPLCPLTDTITPPSTTTTSLITTTTAAPTTTTNPNSDFTPLTTATTDVTLGSFLAAANLNNTQVKLLNALFSRIGTGVNLDAVSYQGLASAQLTERQLATALGLASPDSLFTGTITYKNFLLASASALAANGGSAAAITALNTLASTVNSNTTINMSTLLRKGSGFQVNQGSRASSFDTYLKFFNLLEGSAFLINGSNAISVPGLVFGVPGITNVDMSLKVIQAAVSRQGMHIGETISTSQVDMTLTITVDADLGGQRAGERLRGTIVVHPQSGGATASPSVIICPSPTGTLSPQDQIAVTGSAIMTTGSENMTLSATVGLAVVDVMSLTVANTSITAAGTNGTATFMYPNEFLPSIGSGGMKRTSNQSLNLSGGFNATAGNSALIGVPLIPLATLDSETNSGLQSAVFSPLQDTVLPSITSTLGIELGGADVGVFGLDCGVPVLVK